MTGSGTLADPYVIWDVNDLQNVSLDLTAYYELGQDIDASATAGWNGGLGFLPIGLWVNWGGVVPPTPWIACAGVYWKQTPFTGHFDGKGHSITELTIHRTRHIAPTTTCPDYHNVGLFSQLSGGAVVQNVNLVNADIDGHDTVGALVGYSFSNATITNCHSSGSVDVEDSDAGGLIGEADDDVTISNCSSSASVTAGTSDAGGLVAAVWDHVSIANSYATGAVIGGGDWVGGLVGFFGFYSTISNCYATGNVQGDDEVGGLAGLCEDGTIEYCYATGDVQGDVMVGGLVGLLNGSSITTEVKQSFAIGSVSAVFNSCGGLVGRTLNDSQLTNVYARGDVASVNYVGGLVGWNISPACTINNGYSTGLVTGTTNVGGLVGDNGGVVNNSFWDTETSGQAISDGGTGKTTVEMKTLLTFLAAGWDITASIWLLVPACNDGYPCLFGVTPSCVLAPVIPFAINKAYALSREEL